jgi:hypothetical protein
MGKVWSGVLCGGLVLAAGAAFADPEPLRVVADEGNSTFSAVFDAPLGERINAVSSAVGCELTLDDKANTGSGSCKVALTTIMVDNEPTKTEHFQQWSTNKKGEPKDCTFEAKFANVKLAGPLTKEKPVAFTADAPFTLCGRAREDGKPEKVTGVVVLLSDSPRAMRIKAHVDGFNREAYHIGPKWTDGWLARVQGLASVVSPDGTLDLKLLAVSAPAAKPK